jgi:hypothetical protein
VVKPTRSAASRSSSSSDTDRALRALVTTCGHIIEGHSFPNSEVKLDRAEVVLSWGTRWEGSVLHVNFLLLGDQMGRLCAACYFCFCVGTRMGRLCLHALFAFGRLWKRVKPAATTAFAFQAPGRLSLYVGYSVLGTTSPPLGTATPGGKALSCMLFLIGGGGHEVGGESVPARADHCGYARTPGTERLSQSVPSLRFYA